MQRMKLQHSQDYEEEAVKLQGKYPDPTDADQLIQRDTFVTAPDGRPVAVLLKERVDPALYRLAYALWKPAVKGSVQNRPTAMGASSLQKIKKDGTLSPYRCIDPGVVKVLRQQGARQAILGWDVKLNDLSRQTERQPELLDGNKRLIQRMDHLLNHYVPTVRAFQRSIVKKNPRSRIRHTAFSTIYLLKDKSAAYHRDTGNLAGGMTALMCCGEFSGGPLILSRWRLALAFRPGDVILFDPSQLHGLLPFAGGRLSAAFYCAGVLGKAA